MSLLCKAASALGRGSAVILLLITASLAARAQAPGVLATEVRALFQRRCAECHDGGPGRRSRGEFRTVLDLEDVVQRYVVAGSPEDSQLWDSLTDREFPMPPEENLPGGLPLSELALLRWWIESGAPVAGAPPAPARPQRTQVLAIVSAFHPIIVHFPVALLLMAAGFELLFCLGWRKAPWSVIRWSVLIGAIGALVSFTSGWIMGQTHPPQSVHLHRWLAAATVVSALAVAALMARSSEAHGARRWWSRGFLFLAAGLVVWTSHLGGVLVHGGGPFSG